MLRFLLSAASIFVLLTATLILPGPVSARRCGEKMPVTLLSLYRNSEFIYVGTYDRSEESEATEETADYRVIPIEKHFSISSALKGESRKLLVLEESEYRYKNQEPAEEAETENDSDGGAKVDNSDDGAASEESDEAGSEDDAGELETGDSELKPGDSVLLFLSKDEDSEQLDLSDYTDGLKKMTAEELSAYEVRIRELNGIFSAEKPKYSDVVAWLVRCAENPFTRWEGTFELQQSFQHMDWQEARAKEAAEKPEPESENSELYFPEQPKEFDTGDPNFAKALSEGEKLILTNILLNRDGPKKVANTEDGTTMARGDRELIELVKRWGDLDVAVNLVDQLRYGSPDTGWNADLMSSIASILDDEELSGISDNYSSIQWQSDDDAAEAEIETEEVETENTEQAIDAAADITAVDVEQTMNSPEAAPIVEADATAPEGNVSEAAPEKDKPKKKTYGEARAELLKKFLDRADKLIAKLQDKKNDN